MMNHSALWKDAWRATAKNGKRFAAIAIICAIGVMMLNGLSSIGADLRGGLDEFFDSTGVHDVSLVSTLGFDDADITALRSVEGVEKAAGVRSQNAYTRVGEKQESATVTSLNPQGIDKPYLSEGHLPKGRHDIAVTRQYLNASGKALGDTLIITAADSASASSPTLIAEGTYTIVGVVTNPSNIVNPTGPLAVTTGGKTVYPLFVAQSAATSGSAYSSAVVTFSGSSALNTYSEEYGELVARNITGIQAIQQTRERARTDEVKSTALQNLETQKANIAELPDGSAQKTSAEQKIAAAEASIKGISTAQWHINDRNAMSSYADVKNESALIMSVGKAFPMLFLVIAMLISLTAITRMIEEDRQLLGTYKALGYTKTETMAKYVLYSSLACLTGGVIGDLLGIFGLPYAMTRGLINQLYLIPHYPLIIDWPMGIGGVALFLVAIVGSAILVTSGQMRLNPAALMLPKAPKAGKTILMQRVGFIWNRLSFLDKVTARNLFRYKSRATMVIIGVLGCTALMTIGFGMGNSAFTLMPRQNTEIATYDAMTLTSDANHEASESELKSDKQVQAAKAVRVEAINLSPHGGTSGSSESATQVGAQLIVVPQGSSLKGYINVLDADGHTISLPQDGAIVTENAAKVLGVSAEGSLNMENAGMETRTVKVNDVARNYTGNYVYMSQQAYQELYGDFTANADLLKLSGDDDADISFTDTLADSDLYLSVVNNAKTARNFTKSFMVFFVIIAFIVVMAAMLAVVVLFTLASTNISERERELATIKVLGFRKREVYSYVNKEMAILAALGTIIGLPCGYYLLEALLHTLNMPGLNIVPKVAWFCYAGAAALSMLFTWLVSLSTNKALDRIDMVGALKSPE
ncbi:MAG: ABC transporter permease [Bifidobacterium crudilactis]|jgi:putative ABC transport system permease protein|nr:ABC transporter permease [Bifidobacterium crudilactis]